MLISLLYHKISEKVLEKEFLYLSKLKKYKIVIPSDKLNFYKSNLNLCLTFDDAYFDFYHLVFPLLKKFKMKAVLAVPVKYILDSTKIDPKIRLNVSSKDFIKYYKEKAPFCTFEEIKEMANSGFVEIASHSYSHKNLLKKNTNFLEKEIIFSKKILEEKLQKKIFSFVYPFGKFNKEIHELAKLHYKYIFRIGSTFNLSWQNRNNIIYRITADKKDLKDILSFKNYPIYLFSYFKNILRKR